MMTLNLFAAVFATVATAANNGGGVLPEASFDSTAAKEFGGDRPHQGAR